MKPAPPSQAARIACLLVPNLPLAAVLRTHPELAGRAVAVTAGTGPRAEILAVTPEAARLGVRTRISVVQGRAICAGLEIRPTSPDLERAARGALLDAALSSSPRAEPAEAAQGLWATECAVNVDASGTAALFRSEAGFAGALAARAHKLGLPAVVAIASSVPVARIAARQLLRADPAAASEETLVIPPGEDAAFLAPLPLELLGPSDSLAESFTRFGLHRVADLVRLPPRSVVNRLGAEVAPLLSLARGEVRSPPPAPPSEEEFGEAQDLEAPIAQLEPLLFVLRGQLSRLVDRLDCRGLAMGEIELSLSLEGGGRDARRVAVAAPTLDVSVLLRLVGLSLEARPPEAAIESVCVSTQGRPVRGDQLDFFRPPGPTPAVLSRTLAELTALCGEGRVGAPAIADSHRPDAYAVAAFTGKPRAGGADLARDAEATRASLALRALRPPVAAQVRAPHGHPEFVRSGLANGHVVHSAGPWRSTGHWWSEEERWAFDHFDVQTSDGLVVRLRYDWTHRTWQIDGVYD